MQHSDSPVVFLVASKRCNAQSIFIEFLSLLQVKVNHHPFSLLVVELLEDLLFASCNGGIVLPHLLSMEELFLCDLRQGPFLLPFINCRSAGHAAVHPIAHTLLALDNPFVVWVSSNAEKASVHVQQEWLALIDQRGAVKVAHGSHHRRSGGPHFLQELRWEWVLAEPSSHH